ncbi:MAG: outer membrane beta-barrel protein [Pseudomonadota bacterium]
MRTTLSITIATLLLVSPAIAADVVESDQVVEFDTGRFDWSGIYVGGTIGYVYAYDDDPAFPIAPGVIIPLESEGENNTAGGFVGYAYQDGDFVYGAEYEYVDLDTQFIGQGVGPIPVFIEDAHALRARIGYAWGESTQLYGFGGAMYTRVNIGLEDWTPIVGGGIDYALTDNLIVGGQYTYSWYDGYDGTPIEGTFDYFAARVAIKF